MSKPRSQKPKVDSSSAVDEPSLVSQILDGTDSESLPFPEWSDLDINLEKWDNSIPAKDKVATNEKLSNVQFEDPLEVHVPPSIGVDYWKRCSEIFPNMTYSIFVSKPTYPDLITPNQHLLKSEFYRSFISSIETLLYLSVTKPFPEEHGSTGYYAQTDRAWRPWHHIYSNCKITKGQSEHTPLYNPFGKYIVRLYWMGSWRKIYVDDLIPVDKSNNVMLPTLYISKPKSQEDEVEFKSEKRPKEKPKGGYVKKEVLELWPMILCKALLKIGALSWKSQHELNDFDIINCLTGWIPQRIKTKDVPSSDLWDIFMAYVERFEWDEVNEGSTKKTASSKSKGKGPEKKEVAQKVAKAAKAIPTNLESMPNGDRYITVCCDNYESYVESDNTSQNKNIDVFISQVRNIPLNRLPPRPELEFWQTFRYEQWAVERGIIPPDIVKLNIKSLKIVDPFKRIEKPAAEIEEPDERFHFYFETDNIEKKSEKSSSRSLKKAPAKTPKNHLEPDPTMWIEFSDIMEKINHINIYFQPRAFKSKAKISDINFIHKTTDYKQIIAPVDSREVKNLPLYLFMDSVDYKFLLINFTQLGNILHLEKHADSSVETIISESEHTETRDMCIEILLKKTEHSDLPTLSEISNKSTLMCTFNTKLVSFVLEKYCWETNTFGESQGIIRTYGNKSILFDLKPGRQSFRLWVSSHAPYVLQVFSDTIMTVGSLEEYLPACTAESQTLTNLCYEFAGCFGRLVQSFGMPEFSISLRNFYQCYKPFGNLTKSELLTVHRALFDEFCKVVAQNSSLPNAVECIRLLFLQIKTFDYINPYNETPHLNPDEYCEDIYIDFAKKMQRAAVEIQAFFKGVYIRQIMKKLNEDHKQYYGIFDVLKKVYMEIFSSDKRLTYCPNLFRNLFERPDMEKLKEKFETYRDMESVVENHAFANSIFINEYGWVPICRCEFYVNSVEPVMIAINLFCNLKNYYVRVFNNDTEEEIRRYTNNVTTQKYECNVYGYTILCHGWAEENTKLSWKLILTHKKMSRNDLVIIPGDFAIQISLRDNYIPNFHNIICRYIVKVYANTILTAHLRTSYDKVKVGLKLMDSNKKVLHETSGVGSALLPVLNLRCNDEASESSIRLIPHKMARRRSSTQSGYSDITYSKLNKKSVESLRSGSQKKNSTGSAGQKKKLSFPDDADGDSTSINNISQPNERYAHEAAGDHGTRRSKGRQSETDSDSVTEKSGRKTSKSKSFEKLNQRPSTQGKQRSSRLGTLNKLLENEQTEYILEGIVLQDSWPLTGEEWQRIQQLRERNYINVMKEKKSSINKKSLVTRKIEEPFWILDLVNEEEDPAEFIPDCSKVNTRVEVKTKWFEDIERHRRGLELRTQFLKENLVFNEEVILDKCLVRSNDPKDFAEYKIEELPIENFTIEPSEVVDEDECITKRSQEYIIDQEVIEQNVREYSDYNKTMQEDYKELLHKQIQNFEILSKWFSEVRQDSKEMIAEAITMKKEYVHKLDTTAKAKGEKKDKDQKKKK